MTRREYVAYGLAYVVGVLCISIALYDLRSQDELSKLQLAYLGAACLMFLTPLAARIVVKVWGAEIEFERIKQEREKAELAAQIARVYFSTMVVMKARIFAHEEITRSLAKLLADGAKTGRLLTLHDLADVFRPKEEPYPSDRIIELGEIYTELEKEGLVQVSGHGTEVSARVVPQLSKAVIEAFSHYEAGSE